MITIRVSGEKADDVFIDITSDEGSIVASTDVKQEDCLKPVYSAQTAAKFAYIAYGDDAHWKTYDGRPMPGWDELRYDVQKHWIEAVKAIVVWLDLDIEPV